MYYKFDVDHDRNRTGVHYNNVVIVVEQSVWESLVLCLVSRFVLLCYLYVGRHTKLRRRRSDFSIDSFRRRIRIPVYDNDVCGLVCHCPKRAVG